MPAAVPAADASSHNAPASAAKPRYTFAHEVGAVLTNALARDDIRRAHGDTTEAKYQATIVNAAHWAGWRVLAIRPALRRNGSYVTPIQGDKGYPDLTLVNPRAGRIVFVELKKAPNKLTADQERWRDAIVDAGGEWYLIHVPDELDSFCQWLAAAWKSA